MAQERFLQQLRSSVQSTKEAAINAIQSQLSKSGDGSFILGRYLDGLNGVRTIIGVNAYTPNGKTITLYDFDAIAEAELQTRLKEVESTLGISTDDSTGGSGSSGGGTTTTNIVDRVTELETIIEKLTSTDETNTESITYKIIEVKDEIIGDENSDTADSDTIEGAKKYADKAIEDELADGGSIDTAIKEAQAAATTKVVRGDDSGDNLVIDEIVNADNSTTYTINLTNIATDSDLQELRKQIGLPSTSEGGSGDGSDGSTTGETKTITQLITEQQNYTTTEIQRVEQTIQQNTDAITVLNGTGEGSVYKTVSDAITELVDGADEKYDTLKEISDYIASDTTNAAQMSNDISDLKKSVIALNEMNVISCTESSLIKVSTSTTTNSDSKTQKTFTICADGIASTDDLNTTKSELEGSISNVSTKLDTEVAQRKAQDTSLQSAINTEIADRQAAITNVQTQITNITGGSSTTNIQYQISSAITDITGDATANGKTLGKLEDRIEELETNVNSSTGTVQTSINTAINSLDYTDTALTNSYVSKVDQTDGKIKVTRALFSNAVVTSDGKTLTEKISQIETSITNAESSAKAAVSKVEVSGNSILTKSEVTDGNGSTTYTINLGDTWDCGTFEYTETEDDSEE